MFELPKLSYGYGSLSRAISAEIMHLHHDKHHQAYVDKLNAAIEAAPELKGRGVDDLLKNIATLPETSRTPVKNNAGGHYNHSFFWSCMSPNGGGEPSGEVAELLSSKYGSFQKFVEQFTTKAMSVFGSGWVWLQPNGDIITTANQDTPIAQGLESPLLCLDVWEHAYYLDYENRRDEYVKTWWNIVDWASVEKRYSER
jgi:Fe-Mn family superoxide dismutase